MGNRKVIITFAFVFSIAFAAFYFVSFQFFGSKEKESRVLYLNQVGIYEDETNAENMCDRLSDKKLTPYAVEKENQIFVVTSIYEDEEKTEKEGDILEEMDLNYLTKKITVEGTEMIKAVDDKEYVRVLQAIEDEDTKS